MSITDNIYCDSGCLIDDRFRCKSTVVNVRDYLVDCNAIRWFHGCTICRVVLFLSTHAGACMLLYLHFCQPSTVASFERPFEVNEMAPVILWLFRHLMVVSKRVL